MSLFEMQALNLFNSLLDCAETEHKLQTFLEEHSDLLPVWFRRGHGLFGDFFISKFQIDTSLITDFAYLTKDSGGWNFVLVELESPTKRLFTREQRHLTFHSELNSAIAQIQTWKEFVRDRGKEAIERVRGFSPWIEREPVQFKFVLVVGRDRELGSERKRKRFYGLDSDTFKVMTYDSLARWHSVNESPKNILRHCGQGFTFKHLHIAPLGFFDALDPTWFTLESKHETILAKSGYDLVSWSKGGQALKHPRDATGLLENPSSYFAEVRARFFDLQNSARLKLLKF